MRSSERWMVGGYLLSIEEAVISWKDLWTAGYIHERTVDCNICKARIK